jgi:hypothetical protein
VDVINPADKQTIAAPKKRGRPPLHGKPMTAAERKRAQRKRAVIQVRRAAETHSLDSVSMEALMTELAASVRCGDPGTVKKIAEELEKRARANLEKIGDNA